MPIRLYDSLTRSLRELSPGQPDGVFRFYNCGPTVYGPAHIGNFRTFIVNDVLRRLLELEFGAAKVKHVRNLTDVDDRTITQAKKEQRPLGDITKYWTKLFHDDCAALNLLPPHAEPTATGYIKEQVNMIEVLMEKGHAYRAADGSVYFKLDSFPGYGGLSRIKERELKVTNTVADADHKDSVSDFALWKAYKPEEDGLVSWAGPRGAVAGRPGWHIECSAMSKSILGDTIDLHTGGVDLLFPHHENEIAQSECCNGTSFSRHWYHSEHLLVDGKKMSRSLGNLYTLADLKAKGVSPLALRFALIAGHPRKQLNFTFESLHAAESALKKLLVIVTVFHDPKYRVAGDGTPSRLGEVLELLRDDLNTPGALGALFKLGHEIMTGIGGGPTDADVATLDQILGVLGFEATKLNALAAAQTKLEAPLDVKALAEQFATADLALDENLKNEIASKLLARGWTIERSTDSKWLLGMAPYIKALAEKRWAAKAAKDFAAADALRKELAAAGWSMLDRKDGYSLEPLKK